MALIIIVTDDISHIPRQTGFYFRIKLYFLTSQTIALFIKIRTDIIRTKNGNTK